MLVFPNISDRSRKALIIQGCDELLPGILAAHTQRIDSNGNNEGVIETIRGTEDVSIRIY